MDERYFLYSIEDCDLQDAKMSTYSKKEKNDSMVRSYNEEHEAAVEHAQWQGWHDCDVNL